MGVPQGCPPRIRTRSSLFHLFYKRSVKLLMSKCFGYADHFKVVSDVSETLQIDAARWWKWSNENFVHLNLYKCSLMVFMGDAPVRIGGVEVEQHATQKDLGLIVHSSLTWTSQAEFRCGKAVKAFHLIRRNIFDSADSYTQLSLYRDYIVPILSYGAVLWKASKNDLKILESVQNKTSKWILRYCPIGYEQRLKKLKLLLVSLYHVLHFLLTFNSIVNDKFQLDLKSTLETVKIDKRRSSVQYKCKQMKIERKKTRKRLLAVSHDFS